MIDQIFKNCKKALFESSIDFAREGLDSDIWEIGPCGKKTILKPQVEQKILAFLSLYTDYNLLHDVEIVHIVGSITTNLYTDETDLDVHLIPKKDSYLLMDEEGQKEIKQWSEDMNVKIGRHPLELYVQINPTGDYLSVGCYDVFSKEWNVGPKIFDKSYDPYTNFSHVLPEVQRLAKEADIDLGELGRDVIDFDVLRQALSHLNGENAIVLKRKLEQKLSEIEEDLQELYGDRSEWVSLRREIDLASAKGDFEKIKQWQDGNAIFKFMVRYQYMAIIKEIENITKKEPVTSNEVDDINGILKRNK